MTIRLSGGADRTVEVADTGLIIRLSPFRGQRLGDVARIETIRLEVARSVTPSDIDAQLGQLLVSAIIFGALLDRNLWGLWLAAIVTDGGADGHVALTLDPDEPRPSTRRWFADPITKAFLEGFRSADGAAGIAADPDACAAAFLGRYLGIHINLDDLATQAEAWWRLRIPGLFLGYANRTTTSTSVSSPTWKRLETGQPVFVARRLRSPSDTSDDDLSAEGLDIALLEKQLKSWLGRKIEADLRTRAIAARNLIYADLEAGRFTTARGVALARWQCERLVSTLDLYRQKPGGVGVEWALKQLRWVVELFEGEVLHEDDPDGADLEELYLEFIEGGASSKECGDRMGAIYSFHKFMECDADWPAIEFDLDSMDVHATADAALIGIKDYKRARELVGSVEAVQIPMGQPEQLAIMRRCILALGFRSGLRMAEVMEITMDDLRHEMSNVELFIRSNAHRKLKSKTSRRLLPLHLFLAPDELDELVGWHQRRLRGLGRSSARDRLFALLGGNERLDGRDAEHRINRALKEATGDENAIFHHLRHSFGSYLLATLSLPAGHEIALPAGLDESCISQSRRTKLLPALTGHGLGRSALYAVSAMLGHSRTPTTLHTYIHLLDWGLSHYLARPAALSDVSRKAEVDPAELLRSRIRRRPILSVRPKEDDWVWEDPQPTGVVIEEWRGLARSVADLDRPEGTILLPRRFGIDLIETIAWGDRMTEIAKLKTQQGSRRHRVFRGPTDSGGARWTRATNTGRDSARYHWPAEYWPMTVPRNGPESRLMDLVWPHHKMVETDHNVRQCVAIFLAKLDPVRCDVPLRPGEEAMEFYRSLLALGIPANLIRGRPQYQGSPNLNPKSRIPLHWDGTPGRLLPPPDSGKVVSRIRMTVVGEDRSVNADDEAASYGWRYAMVLLAATSTIDIAEIANPPRSERTERRKRKKAEKVSSAV